ncbi:MAG: hypothetical protein FJ026_00195 [Chloroflexi bacterium]|nr:hypothetical protein [Chloroflexota bacterium]
MALAYQPDRFHALPIGEQRAVRQVLDWNLPGSLNHFLDQLDTFADLSPLVEAFDPTAEGLPASPAPADIHKFCSALRQLPTAPPERPPIQERLQSLLEFVLGPLRFQAVYLLVDGVDAHAETVSEPKAALLLLRPLLEQIHPWAQRRLFLKCFLPVELQPLIRSVKPNILTKDVKAVTIIWSHETLVQILRERLRVASEGMFDSFDAICIPALRDVEADLVRTAKPLPREVLVLAQRLFWEHVRHAGPAGRLEPVDLDHALAWYATTPVL